MSERRERSGVGRLIRERREVLGISQVALSERTGIPQRTISRIENSTDPDYLPESRLLIPLARELELSMEDLLRAAGYLEPEGPDGAGDARPSAVEIYTMAMEQVQSDDDLMPEERDAILSALRLAHSIRRQRRGGRD